MNRLHVSRNGQSEYALLEYLRSHDGDASTWGRRQACVLFTLGPGEVDESVLDWPGPNVNKPDRFRSKARVRDVVGTIGFERYVLIGCISVGLRRGGESAYVILFRCLFRNMRHIISCLEYGVLFQPQGLVCPTPSYGNSILYAQ